MNEFIPITNGEVHDLYAFSRTISDVLCIFKRFHNFIFHQSARWVYLGPGVKVGSLFWSARREGAGDLEHTLKTTFRVG